MDYIIVGVAAFFISIGSAIAGGGGGLVMTPLAILLGFPAQAVLASQKAAGLGINLGALNKFRKQEDIIHWKWAIYLSVAAILASLIGTQIVFRFNTETLENMVGIATLILVPIVFLNRNTGLKNHEVTTTKKIIGMMLAFIIFVFQAGLGSGIGTLLMFVFMGLLGFDALRANATKRLTGLALVSVSFIIFAFSGYMDWLLALILGVAMFFGGQIGAHLAIKHGNVLVKRALLVVSAIMAISVLLR